MDMVPIPRKHLCILYASRMEVGEEMHHIPLDNVSTMLEESIWADLFLSLNH